RLAIAHEFNNKSAEMLACGNLGNAHVALGKFEIAAEYQKRRHKVIAKHLSECPRNATYTSAAIQNDIIKIIGEYLRNQIISEMPEQAPFFTILADEASDVSNAEQHT
ncbi:hypothetical protein QZH41_018932, partial [Actinostola sp. cb2023]